MANTHPFDEDTEHPFDEVTERKQDACIESSEVGGHFLPVT